MSSPIRSNAPERDPFLLAEEQDVWEKRRTSVATARDRSAAIALALRGIRTAPPFTTVTAAIESILTRYLGAEAFAILEPADDSWHTILAHGVEPAELAELTRTLRGPSYAALAWCPLRAGKSTLGWLGIYRLVRTKRSLDAFDLELIEALGPFIAVAFEEARAMTRQTAERPQSVTRLRIK